jgi:hypothetical protein
LETLKATTMNLITNLKQKIKVPKQQDAEKEASNRIRVKDVDGKLYIAFDSFPLIEIDEMKSASTIMDELKVYRSNFLKYTGYEEESK